MSRTISWPFDYTSEEAQYVSATFADLLRLLEADNVEAAPADFLLENGGTGFCARANLHAIVSRRKQGKTFCALAKCAAILGGDFAGVTARAEGLRVLVFDTEQSESDIKARKASIIKAARDFNPNDLAYICARYKREEADPWNSDSVQAWRRKLLLYLAENFRPDYIVLDGIADLCADFNSNEEAAAVVEELLALAASTGAAIDCVIHENEKQGKDTATGHIGTALMKKCADYFGTSKFSTLDGTTITCRMSAKGSRHKAAPPFALCVADDWEFLPAEAPALDDEEESEAEHTPRTRGRKAARVEAYEEEMAELLTPEEEYSANDFGCVEISAEVLRKRYKQKHPDRPRNAATRFVQKLEEMQILLPNFDGTAYTYNPPL